LQQAYIPTRTLRNSYHERWPIGPRLLLLRSLLRSTELRQVQRPGRAVYVTCSRMLVGVDAEGQTDGALPESG